MSYLKNYFQQVPDLQRSSAVIALLAGLDHLRIASPLVADQIVQELRDQRSSLKLIASENYCSLAVQIAMGNWLTDKYAEGIPGHRFYAGCSHVDAIEQEAASLVQQLFGAGHAYVQPHSGADANLVAFWAVLLQRVQQPALEELGKKTLESLTEEEYERIRMALVSQKMMGMSLGSGGHLTHGYRHNVSGKFFRSVGYDVDRHTGLIDYSALRAQVQRERPLLLIAGYSAYPRRINFAIMREIADSVGATLMVDMAHFAGLVAGKVFQGDEDPLPFADIVTSTTHKTLRGPRGGLVLCKPHLREFVDKGCPLVLGGPLPHVIAAKAVAFREASSPDFAQYAQQIVDNARVLAEALQQQGIRVITGGTDNHLVLIDVTAPFGLTGRQAEHALRAAGLTASRNAIPFDPNGPWYTSGIRLGTAALTTLGMGPSEMKEIAGWIYQVLSHTKAAPAESGEGFSRAKIVLDPTCQKGISAQIGELLTHFPLYPELFLTTT